MTGSLVRGLGEAFRGVAVAIRSRTAVFLWTATSVFALDIAIPPLVLSLARKPVDYFTFNPWLRRLPEYVTAGPGSLGERAEKAWSLALFWFSSDNPYGVEWGFAVTGADLARFALMSVLIGAYFALWAYQRGRLGGLRWTSRFTAQGGVLGAGSSVFGLATGGCTVMGCGAPVIPVVGLAFAGLSSGTLKWLSALSTIATAGVLTGMSLGVLYLGWRAVNPRISIAPLEGWRLGERDGEGPAADRPA